MKTIHTIRHLMMTVLLLQAVMTYAQHAEDNDSTLVNPFLGWTDEQIDAYEDSVIQSLYPQPDVIEKIPEAVLYDKEDTRNTLNAQGEILRSGGTDVIDYTKAVGQIEIRSGMTPSGAKTYTIPIHSYAVEGKPYPGISLTYNSQRGRSVAGVGWNIGGISVITRGRQPTFYDPVTLTRSSTGTKYDTFFLDGKKLYFHFGTPYYYETETGQIRVKANYQNGKIKYFDVYYPDGRHAVMGFTDNTEERLVYPITSMTDALGNTITYDYTLSNGYYDITHITYNGAEIIFSYEDNRTDPISWFIAGRKSEMTRLLSGITCKLDGVTLCEYILSYLTRENTSLLRQVDYQSGDTSLNPLRFTYGNMTEAEGYDTNSHHVMAQGYDDVSLCHVRKARLNYGSSSDDVIVFPIKDPYWNKKRGGGLFHHSQDYLKNQYTGNEDIFIYHDDGTQETLKTGSGFIDLLVADFYGDRQECIVRINNTVVNDSDKVTFTVYRKGNNGLEQYLVRNFRDITVFTDNDGKKSIQPKRFFAGDFLGNGRMQIMAVSMTNAQGESGRPSKCYIYDLVNNTDEDLGNALTYRERLFGTNETNADSVEYYSDRLMVMDFNGDGKADICHVSSSGMLIYTYESHNLHHTALNTSITRGNLFKRRMIACELNGDGLTDLLITPSYVVSNDNIWNSYISKGDGTYEMSNVNGPATFSGTSVNYDFHAIDVSHDGISEIISTGASTIRTYRYTGNMLSHIYSMISESPTVVVSPTLFTHNQFGRITTLANDLSVNRYFYKKDARKTRLITDMTDSHGVTESNSYVLGSREYTTDWYSSKGSGAQYPYVNILEPMQLLTSSRVYMGGVLADSHTYRYSNGISHLQGKGFCGFTTIREYDRRGNLTTKTYAPTHRSVLTSEETPAYRNTYAYDTQDNEDFYKILLTEAEHEDLLTGITTTTSYEYDTYGFPTSETSEASDGLGTTKSHEYVHTDNKPLQPMNFRLGLVTASEKTVHSPGTGATSSFTERTEISSHTASGLPLSVNTYVNDNPATHTAYTYDSQGNVQTETVRKFSSADSLTTTHTYDTYGRRLSTTTPLGQTTSVIYDGRGRIVTSTDCLGNTTMYSYDGLDRQISITYPDNTTSSTSYLWTSSSEGGLFKVVTQATGEPSGTIIYDALGREKTSVRQILGGYSYTDKVYDTYGRLWKESLPHLDNVTEKWIVYSYDEYDRLSSITDAVGLTTTYSYSGSAVTATDSNGRSVEKMLDSRGNTVGVTTPEHRILYARTATGAPMAINALPYGMTAIAYDGYGRRMTLFTQELGVNTFTYDDDGNLYSQTNGNDETITYTYDTYGRLTGKTTPEMSTSYTYNGLSQLTSAVSSNGSGKTFTYDTLGRLSSRTTTAPGDKWLREDFAYTNGNVSSVTYTSQSGILTTENYTYQDGGLKRVTLSDGTIVYELGSVNAQEMPTSVTTGQVSRSYSYSDVGRAISQQARHGTAAPVQDIGYGSYSLSGNLLSRTDNRRSITEQFGYDTLDRLTSFGGNTVTYSPDGNITAKSDVGTYEYGIIMNPHAVTDVTPTGNAIPLRDQDITYTSFSRPDTIAENSMEAVFTYDEGGDRVRMTLTDGDDTRLTRYYLGDCYEMDITPDSTREVLYLGGDYYTAPAVLIKDSIGSQLYYILRDRQGSITHVIDNDGNVVQELSYDAWGRLRNPATQQIYAPDSIPDLFLGRGYTGHEHLPWFGLINMNARLYDPTLGRFLSGDPEVLDMEDLQCLNRYSYCLNNPLAYVDPTGETIWVTYDWSAQQFFDRNYWRNYIHMNRNNNVWWLFGDDAYGHGAVYYNDETNVFMKWIGDVFHRVNGDLDWNGDTWNTYRNSSQTGSGGYSGGSTGRTSGRSSNSSTNTIRSTFSVTGNANSITEYIYNNKLKTSQKSKIVHDVKKNLKNNYDIKIKTKTSDIYNKAIPKGFKVVSKGLAASSAIVELYDISRNGFKPSNALSLGVTAVGAVTLLPVSSTVAATIVVATTLYTLGDAITGDVTGKSIGDRVDDYYGY